jgi:hypothetical protein
MFDIGRQILDSGITVLFVEQQMKRALPCAYASGLTNDLIRYEHVKHVYLGM